MTTATAQTKQPAPAAHTITLEKIPPAYKGERAGRSFHVMVDDVAWATVRRESRGMHGYFYKFDQIGGEEISRKRERSPTHRGVDQWDAVTVRGAGKADQRRRFGEPDPRTTEQRLIDIARELITEGLLKHPDQQAAEVAERRKGLAEREAAREAESAAEFERRAAECLDPIKEHIGENMLATMTANIIAAMKWAQTK